MLVLEDNKSHFMLQPLIDRVSCMTLKSYTLLDLRLKQCSCQWWLLVDLTMNNMISSDFIWKHQPMYAPRISHAWAVGTYFQGHFWFSHNKDITIDHPIAVISSTRSLLIRITSRESCVWMASTYQGSFMCINVLEIEEVYSMQDIKKKIVDMVPNMECIYTKGAEREHHQCHRSWIYK